MDCLVTAEWTDASGNSWALGSLIPHRKRDAPSTATVATDAYARVWVRFRLVFMVRTAGKGRAMELLLVIPPHSLRSADALSYQELEIAYIHPPAVFCAAGDARLFEAGRVMRAHLSLDQPGRVLIPKTTANRITLVSSTTTYVLSMLRPLSQAHRF